MSLREPSELRGALNTFAAHLRHPERHAAPAGIEDRRLRIYRELFYNNVEGLLANAFPVVRSISSDAAWHARVRDFYARHGSHAPQFNRIAEEFVRFLADERGGHPDDPPFLVDLAHYEWVEIALGIAMEEIDDVAADPAGDLLEGAPVVSPLAWSLSYAWPVHRIGPNFQPTIPAPNPTYLIVHRDREDQVRFLEVNAVTARLLQLIEEQPGLAGKSLLLRIADELGHPQPESVIAEGRAILADLRERDIVLGTAVSR